MHSYSPEFSSDECTADESCSMGSTKSKSNGIPTRHSVKGTSDGNGSTRRYTSWLPPRHSFQSLRKRTAISTSPTRTISRLPPECISPELFHHGIHRRPRSLREHPRRFFQKYLQCGFLANCVLSKHDTIAGTTTSLFRQKHTRRVSPWSTASTGIQQGSTTPSIAHVLHAFS